MYLLTQTDNFRYFYDGFGNLADANYGGISTSTLSYGNFDRDTLLDLGRFNPSFDGSRFFESLALDILGMNSFAGGPLSNSIPGDTSTTATLAVGAQVVSTIDFAGDTDWFEVTLVAGTTYDISQLGHGGGLVDPLVRIMDSVGTELANNDDIILGSFRDSLLTFTAATSGTYYISAEAWSNNTGSYTLSLNQTNAGDVAASTATTASAILNGSLSGTIEVAGDSDWYEITLTAGSRYIISNTGFGGTILSNSFLELRDSTGAVIESDNDDGPGANARLAYNITTTGTYYIAASAFGNVTGDYAVTVEEVPLLVERDLDGIANFLTDEFSVRQSYNAGGGGATVINFSFASGANSLSAGAEALARRALDAWASVANITFVEGPGDIVFRNNGDGAFNANTRSGSLILSSDLNVSSTWNGGNTNLDSYTYQTFLHEIGHALGLGHAGPYNATAVYNLDNAYLNDSWAYTVMSYFDQNDSGYFGDLRFVLGPQIADIIAIQNLYGANTTTRNGDTVYGFNSTETDVHNFSQFTRTPSLSIFDTGGTDTLDFSGYSQTQRIDLRPETFSDVNGISGAISIARGVIIENAIGGTGIDTITGNDASNVLTGGGGNDILNGGAGIDYAVFSGASINDYTITDNGDGTFTVTHKNGGSDGSDTLSNIEFLRIGGVDTALSSASPEITLTENVDNYTATTGDDTINALGGNDIVSALAGNDTVNGGGGNDFLYGGSGTDTLNGDADNDVLVGDAGADTLNGGAGNDLLYGSDATQGVDFSVVNILNGGAGNDTLVAAAGGDQLFGNDGADTLYGGLGNDFLYATDASQLGDAGVTNTLWGGIGDDSLFGAQGLDVLVGGSGVDTMRGGAGGDYLYAGTQNDTLYGEVGNDFLVGNDGADTLYGGSGNDVLYATDSTQLGDVGLTNTLWGGSGIDTLLGAQGNDTLVGEADTDYLWGGSGNDFLYGGDGSDILNGQDDNDYLIGNAGLDTLLGGNGNDVLYATDPTQIGDVGILNTLYGGIGNDSLFGAQGGDTLLGEAGNDVLDGGAGADFLYGGSGADRLHGGLGDDILNAGAADGAIDVLVFSANWGTDTIYEFENGTDKIDFTGVAGLTSFGQLTITDISGAAAISTSFGTIYVVGATASQIDASDFSFANATEELDLDKSSVFESFVGIVDGFGNINEENTVSEGFATGDAWKVFDDTVANFPVQQIDEIELGLDENYYDIFANSFFDIL